jgi:hypothetical protein
VCSEYYSRDLEGIESLLLFLLNNKFTYIEDAENNEISLLIDHRAEKRKIYFLINNKTIPYVIVDLPEIGIHIGVY